MMRTMSLSILMLLAGPSVGLAQGGGRITGRVTSAESLCSASQTVLGRAGGDGGVRQCDGDWLNPRKLSADLVEVGR